MRVLILTDVVANKAPQKEGAEVDVSPKDGRALIQMGKAVEIKKQSPIQDVEPKPKKKPGRPKKQIEE